MNIRETLERQALRAVVALLLLTTFTSVARLHAEEPSTKPAFRSFKMGGPMPEPVDVGKLERVADGMTSGAIVDELGPGWMSQAESAGIITWFLSDGRKLRIWPAEYKADEVITKQGESGRSRMWIQTSTHIRLNPTTAPAATQAD